MEQRETHYRIIGARNAIGVSRQSARMDALEQSPRENSNPLRRIASRGCGVHPAASQRQYKKRWRPDATTMEFTAYAI